MLQYWVGVTMSRFGVRKWRGLLCTVLDLCCVGSDVVELLACCCRSVLLAGWKLVMRVNGALMGAVGRLCCRMGWDGMGWPGNVGTSVCMLGNLDTM